MLKISIITPCLDSFDLLKETVFSVLCQNAYINESVELEYIICDGGSQDGTAQWVEKLNHPAVQFFSEKDNGVYDALAKGLSRCTGDVVAYLNCGDYYSPYTFNILNEVFSNFSTKWITGYNAWYNQKGYLVSANLPYCYRRNFILKGMYGTFLPWIQQESTFWRYELNATINLETLSRFKSAGDYYLWHQFAMVAELNTVKAYLGGFRLHSGQLSENKKQYKAELLTIVDQKPDVFDYFQASIDYILWWFLPDRLKLILNSRIINI
jgi:glycosyltransferase involved in cell wall biosynthesis